MEKELIINADGFGFTPGVNKGIWECIQRGVVTSTSCVVNFPSITEAKELAKLSRVSIGLHYNLSVGKPCAPPDQVPSLLNDRGEFWRELLFQRLSSGHIKKDHVMRELEAQTRTLLDLGIQPTHWDGHQHKHLHPLFFFCAVKVARKHNIRHFRSHRRYFPFEGRGSNGLGKVSAYYLRHPKRLMIHTASRFFTWLGQKYGFKTADRLISPGYLDKRGFDQKETWRAVLNDLPPGRNELYCHPGYPGALLRQYALYVDERLLEKDILVSEEIRNLIQKNHIKLISFHDF